MGWRCGFALGMALTAVGWPVPGAGQTWQMPEAEMRLVLRRRADSSWPAQAGEVVVWPQNIAAEDLRVAVYGEDGAKLQSRVFWAARGEPVKVAFDTSGGQMRYLLYLSDDQTSSAGAWEPQSGLLIETRGLPEGPFDTAEQITALWSAAKAVQGRSYVPRIFLGANPHGPTSDFVALFRGYLRIGESGAYEFATASDDGSVVLIDDRKVVAWPGRHVAGPGVNGRFKGRVELEPGLHRIDYYWVQAGQTAAAVGAWKPPGAEGFEVIPPAAFEPIARFEVEGVQGPPSARVPAAYLDWSPLYHSMIDELALVTVEMRLPGADPGWDVEFQTDDGARIKGSRVHHTFLRPGIREVRVEISASGRVVRSLRQKLDVRPRWEQTEMWTEFNFLKQREELMVRDCSGAPVDDLAALVTLAGRIPDRGLLSRLGAVCLERIKDFKSPHWEAFLQLGRHYAHADTRDYAAADRALRAAVRLAGKVQPAASRARLGLAAFVLDVLGNPQEAATLMADIAPGELSEAEEWEAGLLRADMHLAMGQADVARKTLEALTPPSEVVGSGTRELRRRAKLEAARDYIRRGDLDVALDLLNLLEHQWAPERLSLESGLLRAEVLKGRDEYPRAASWCRKLLTVAEGENLRDARAELLYILIETEKGMGRQEEADRVFKRLVVEHPFSEAAARATEAWGSPSAEAKQQ